MSGSEEPEECFWNGFKAQGENIHGECSVIIGFCTVFNGKTVCRCDLNALEEGEAGPQGSPTAALGPQRVPASAEDQGLPCEAGKVGVLGQEVCRMIEIQAARLGEVGDRPEDLAFGLLKGGRPGGCARLVQGQGLRGANQALGRQARSYGPRL